MRAILGVKGKVRGEEEQRVRYQYLVVVFVNSFGKVGKSDEVKSPTIEGQIENWPQGYVLYAHVVVILLEMVGIFLMELCELVVNVTLPIHNPYHEKGTYIR